MGNIIIIMIINIMMCYSGASFQTSSLKLLTCGSQTELLTATWFLVSKMAKDDFFKTKYRNRNIILCLFVMFVLWMTHLQFFEEFGFQTFWCISIFSVSCISWVTAWKAQVCSRISFSFFSEILMNLVESKMESKSIPVTAWKAQVWPQMGKKWYSG